MMVIQLLFNNNIVELYSFICAALLCYGLYCLTNKRLSLSVVLGFYISTKGEPEMRVTSPPQAIETSTVKDKEIINRLVYKNFLLEFHYSITQSEWLLGMYI